MFGVDGGEPHPGYCWIIEFVLSDRVSGIAHPFVFNSHVIATCCGHHGVLDGLVFCDELAC